MKEQLLELLENQQITQNELVELLHGYVKLVKAKIFTQEEFNVVLDRLGVELKPGNVFVFDENSEYILN
jgi:hypothetical protein